jgi:putative PIN family toxin of toxin-antitoxin system
MSANTTRAVLDTNLVLSALIFQQGRLVPLRTLWQTGAIRPLVSRLTVAELMRALGYPKFKLTASEQEELLADYLPYCETHVMSQPPPATPACRDPADVPFLQLALASNADALVTGDLDLLALAAHFPCAILSASAFLAPFDH